MGCTNSSLACPNTFTDIDATPSSKPVTWLPKGQTKNKHPTPDPTESSLSAEAYKHTTPVMRRDERGFGSGGDRGLGNSTSPEVMMGESERKGARGLVAEHEHEEEGGWDHDDTSNAAAVKQPTSTQPQYPEEEEEKLKDPATMNGKIEARPIPTKEYYAEQEAEEKARVKESLKAEMVDAQTGRKKGMYQRLQARKRGVGEERDPVTGRGKYTGMTKEETIEYVQRTRGSGMHSAQKYTFVGTEGAAAWGY